LDIFSKAWKIGFIFDLGRLEKDCRVDRFERFRLTLFKNARLKRKNERRGFIVASR